MLILRMLDAIPSVDMCSVENAELLPVLWPCLIWVLCIYSSRFNLCQTPGIVDRRKKEVALILALEVTIAFDAALDCARENELALGGA